MRRLAWLVGMLLLIAAAPPPAGTFGNVFVHPETDDMLGIELAFQPEYAVVEMVLCEGGCSYISRSPYSEKDDVFSFEYREPRVDQRGATVKPFILTLMVRRKGRNLIVWSPDPDILPPTVLKPLLQPFGLAVAKEQ